MSAKYYCYFSFLVDSSFHWVLAYFSCVGTCDSLCLFFKMASYSKDQETGASNISCSANMIKNWSKQAII